MSTLEKERVREARGKHLRDRMPRVQQSSRRLQSALEILDTDPWPTPIVPFQVHKDLIKSNTVRLRNALRHCEFFAVDMARKTEKLDFLDDRVLDFHQEKLKTLAAKQEQSVAEPEEVDFAKKFFEDHPYTGVDRDTLDAVMTDAEHETTPKMGSTIQDAVSGEATPKALDISEASNEDASPRGDQHNTALSKEARNESESKGSSNVAFAQRGKESPQSAIPDPLSMRGTFTNAICHQKEFLPAPILALTMMDVTRTLHAPTTRRCVLLSHLEVGLDGVEALCQGFVTIDESTYWRENVREPRTGRLGIVKAGRGGYSEALEQEQLKKGMGQGGWLWFGIKFQQSGKERKKGKGGKWACFGVPMEAVREGEREEGTAMYGGGVDRDGNTVPKTEVKVERLTCRLSVGGIACMDLWEGAEQWQNGAWGKIKKAMAHTGLLIRIVLPRDDKMMGVAQGRAGNEGEEEVVEGKGKGRA